MEAKLKELSLESEVIDKIKAILKDEIKDKYVPKHRFDEVIDARNQFEKDLGERDKQLEELKKSSGDSEALKQRIEELQNDNKKAKESYELQVKNMKRDDFVKTTLIESGLLDVKYIPGVSAYLPIADLDIENTTSVDAFKAKIAETKTIAPSWFKSDDPPTIEINGMKISDPTNKVSPTQETVDKTSYEYFLSQAIKNKG